MSENVTNIALSKQATQIADKMKESGIFPDALAAAKFGMAFALKYYWDEIDSQDELLRWEKDVYDASGHNYNIGSVDPDKFIYQIMGALYPNNNNNHYKFTRALMCFGLNKLGDLLDEGELFPINKKM